jgi:hypothetical protein
MKKNMGTIDKVLRIVAAVVMLILFFSGIITGALGIFLIVLSVVFVITSLISFCPLPSFWFKYQEKRIIKAVTSLWPSV